MTTITAEIHDELTAAVTSYLGNLQTDDRQTVVAWRVGSHVRVASEFPSVVRGPSGVTSCSRTSPVGNVVSRLSNGLEGGI